MNDEATNRAAGGPNGRFPPHPPHKLHPTCRARTHDPTHHHCARCPAHLCPHAYRHPRTNAHPTYSQQANQLLLADGRFTTLLDNLTQEIGRDLSDAEQEQVLALARALWLPPPEADLPDHLDESDWLPNPAGVSLHWRTSLDGREGPVLLVEEAQPDSPYAAGALIFWRVEGLLSLTPGGPGYYFEFGRVQQNNWDFETWIEYDANDNLYSFIHSETGQYVTPQGDGTVFILSDLRSDGRPTNGQFYWENGGEPVRIAAYHDGRPMQDVLDDPGFQNTKEFVTVTIDGREYLATALTTPPRTDYYYDTDTETWIEYRISTVNAQAEAMKVIENAQNLIHESVRDGLQLQIAATDELIEGHGGTLYAVITSKEATNNGVNWFINQNQANNGGEFTLPVYNPETGTVQPTVVSRDSAINVTLVSYYERRNWLPLHYGVGDPVRIGIYLNGDNIEIVIQASSAMSSHESSDSAQQIWDTVLNVFGIFTSQVNKNISEDGRINNPNSNFEAARDNFNNFSDKDSQPKMNYSTHFFGRYDIHIHKWSEPFQVEDWLIQIPKEIEP